MKGNEYFGRVFWVKKNLEEDTPLHFNRFYPQCGMKALPPTPVLTLDRAHEITGDEGLRFVYVGNVEGHRHANTFCPACGAPCLSKGVFLRSRRTA